MELLHLTLYDRSHYYTKPHRFTQFLQLAVSLVIELRLDRPPTTESWKTSLRFAPQGNPNEQAYTRPSWGNDEKRAVLGCYYLSSSVPHLSMTPVESAHGCSLLAWLSFCKSTLHSLTFHILTIAARRSAG